MLLFRRAAFGLTLATLFALIGCSGGVQSPIPPSQSQSAGSTVVPQSVTAPSLAWSPSSAGTFDFGTQSGGSKTSQIFTLTNSGRAASAVLVVGFGAGTSSDFSITADTCTGTSLGPKKSCTVTVQFAPAALDDATGALNATGKKPPATASVNLKGNAVHTTTFSYTGAAQTFSVPEGITKVVITADGAEGGLQGFASCTAGGSGASITATIPIVTPQETLTVYVGGGGSNQPNPGFNGGGGDGLHQGGGGASDVREGGTALSNRVIVAGGGGSGACGGGSGSGGNGGAPPPANGVDGTASSDGGGGGGGGTQSAGGAVGNSTCGSSCDGTAGTSGSLGVGGVGFDSGISGGDGGGGYYGGGGSGEGCSEVVGSSCGQSGLEGGGGGGSSFVESTATNVLGTAGGNTSLNGQVTITY